MEEERVNPWLSMWRKPRETVRIYLDEGLTKWLWLLPILIGIKLFLDNADVQNVGDQVSVGSILFLSIIFGIVIGLTHWFLLSGAITLIGNLLSIRAEWSAVRKAVSLSYVPAAWMLLLWIVRLFAFGVENFTPQTPTIDASIPKLTLIVFCYIIDYIVMVFSFIVLSKSVAEVYEFSAWKAFGLILLSVIVLAMVFLILLLPVVHKMST
ncbi:hypothetical protein JQC72_06590 [Polycladomyces sp. WAk]|uniref:Yip1 domain-containing protein n=1 Tax=Polycladomyces zharkentensis TaxID=2807616 RepID=A0ABS2WI39_9BACL|nr:hypothetical protein [Polycladomyces sp. WAk]MBN2909189.1 hypothetical protein [Polycladomyces sp. WAk]